MFGEIMDKKQFNRGTMTGGIVRIVIAFIAAAIAATVISTAIGSHDPDDGAGSLIFMCIIGGIMLVASVGFVINGIKMIIDGRKSFIVARKGHPESGRITDLSETEVTENHNGCVSRYTIYNLKFEYTDDSGNLCESEEQISRAAYDTLGEMTLVPILVYGERAIFDKNRLGS